jgi:tape measure domain-containing protein
MGKLGDLYYEIKFKDSTSNGVKSIESKIKSLNATIKPRILIKDVNAELSRVGQSKNLNLEIKVKINANDVKQSVDKLFTSDKSYPINIKANTSTLASEIQNAIDKGTYIAKITADTSGVVEAVKNALSKPIDVNIKENTTSNASGGQKALSNSSKKKSGSTNDVSSEQKELERLQKAYDKIISKSQQAVGNVTRFSNLRANGEMSIGLKAARDRILSLQQEMKKTSSTGFGFNASKVQELSNAIRVAHEQMRLYRSELQKNQQIQRRVGSENPLSYRIVSKDNGNIIKTLSDIANKYESQIAAIKEKIRNAHGVKEGTVFDYIRGLNAQLDALSRKAEATRATIARMSNMQNVMTVNQPAQKGSALWKEQQERERLARDSRRAEITRAFKEQEKSAKEQKKLSSAQKEQAKATEEQKKSAEKFEKELERLQKKLAEVGNKGSWLKSQLQNVFSAYVLKDFFMNLINIGGEFEKQKLALNAMLGSMDKANTLYTQIKDLAVKSPFRFGELTNYTKQLTSFGFQYKDIFSTTKKLADISAGVGVDMSRIILAYGQVFTAHYLRGQELRQFTEAGIPMVDALAKRFTNLKGEAVSAGDIFKMISNREVAFEDVKAVLDEMTDSGGRFYNMQEKLSESLSGKWSNLHDQIEIMYSEIEAGNKGILKGIVSFMTAFVKNWKLLSNIAVGALVFYALLSTKNRLLNAMTNGVTNGLKTSLAASYANQTALREETELYNNLIRKIRERNRELINSKAAAVNPALLRGTGLNAGGSSMTGFEQRELLLQRARMNLLGANVSSDSIRKIIEGGNKIGWLSRRIISLGDSAQKASMKSTPLLGNIYRGAIKGGIGVLSLANSFGQFAKTMLTGFNGWFLAISAIISLIFNWQQEKEEFEKNLKDSIEGAKQAYEEFSKFVKDNPIDIAINSNDDRAIDKLLQTYKEELENAPLELGWVVTSGDDILNRTERLKYYKQALEDAAEAEKALSGGESFNIAHNAMEYTKEWYPWSDTASHNLNDMIGGMSKLRKEIDNINPEKLDKALDNIYKKVPKYRNAIEEYRKGLLSLNALVYEMHDDVMRTNSYDKLFGIFDDFRFAFVNGGTFTKSVKTQISEYKNDINDLYKFIEDKAKNEPKLGINFNNLDNKGFMKFEKIIKDMATEQQWSQDKIDMVMADLTSRMTPAKGATWLFDTGIYKEALDTMSEYTDEFKGKTKQQIEEGLKDGSKSGMRKALDNAKSEISAKWPFLADEIQRVFNSKDFHINLSVRLSKPNIKANGFQRDFNDFLDGKNWGHDIIRSTRAKYEAIGPKEGEDILETISRLQNDQKNLADKIDALRKYNKKNGNKQAAELQDAIDKRNRYKDILKNFYNVELEKSNSEKSNDKSAKNKSKELNRKLRDEEKRLQNEFKQLKKVKDLYEKLRDLYGDIGALNKIRNSGLVAAKYIPKNVTSREDFNKKYKELISNLSKRISPKSDALKNLKDELQSDLFDISFNVDKDELDRQVSILETELQRAEEAWDRYINLINGGLDRNMAGIMTFGIDSNRTDRTQQKTELQSRAYNYISRKTGRVVDNKEMDNILNMNEMELKVHFGNNAEITNGLWKIVEAYQNVAKEIRSENDKLVSDLYKDSLSYAERIDNISKKEKRDIATIKEGANNNRVATKTYNNALANQESIRVQIENEQNALDNSDIGRAFRSALEVMNKAKAAISDFDKKNGKDLTPKQKNERQNLVNTYNTTTVSYNKAQTNYQNSTQYKTIEALRPQQEKAIKETTNAQRAISETIPESQSDRLIAQVTLNANKEKGEVMDEMFTKRGDYSQLFNNIYSLAVDNANKIAEELIAILDQRLEEGTITADDYNKKRTEITEQAQKANENRKNNSVFLNGLSGITKSRYDQAIGRKNDAANKMETAKRNEESVDKNAKMTPAMKVAAKALYQQDFKKAKEDYKKAEEEGNNQKKKEARQDMIGSALGMIGNAAESMAQFRDTLGETINAFGGDTENNKGFQTFSTAVDVMGDISSGMTNAFQSIMSGDFFGAAMSIITTPLNIANAFAKLHDKKLEIQINQSKERAKQIKAAADQISNSIENSLGSESAKRDVLMDYQQLKRQVNAAGKADFFGDGYQAIIDLLEKSDGGVKYVDSYEKKLDEERARLQSQADYYNQITSNSSKLNSAWVEKQLASSASFFRNKEVLEALKKQGFDSGKDISVYGAQYAALLEQRKELEYQLNKKTNESNKNEKEIKDYRDQISDMNKQIREFTENLAKELYGIDISSWASKLGDSLTTAFKNGEDAAQAFKKTVDEILSETVKNMFIQDSIKPLLTGLEEKVFGVNGSGGILDMNDLEGSMPKVLEFINDYMNNEVAPKVPFLSDSYEKLNQMLGGSLKDSTSASSSMTISAQGLTEETGDLLASYVNAIRADVSISRGYIQSLVEISIPQMNAVAESQLRQLNAIVEQSKLIEANTRANTVAAESIRKSFDSVISTSGSGKAIRIKA